MVPPASKATPRRPAAAAPRKVSGPMVGRSVRRSCPGLTSFTSTPPRPGRASDMQRASIASVPSAASTASTIPCCTTQPCPTSVAPSALATAMPRRMSAIATASGEACDSLPAGPSASLRISWAPSTRNPSSAKILTTAASNPSSPANAARPMRARMRAPSASGRRSSSEGRRTGPTSTRSWHPCSRSAAIIRPAARMRTISCGQGASTAGSAKPSSPTRNTLRPVARAAAAT